MSSRPSSASQANASILPDYAPDPQRPAGRRARTLMVALVVLFCLIWGFGFALFGQFAMLFFAAPLPILALMAIWALPDAARSPVRSLTAFLFLYMACLVLWPNYIAFAPPGVPWITMTRLTGFPLLALFLICLSTSSKIRSLSAGVIKAAPILTTFLVSFAVLEGASIFYSKSPIASFNLFLNAQIAGTMIFFISIYVFIKPGRIESMVRLLWYAAVPIGVIAFFEARVQHPLWLGHIPAILQIDDLNVKAALAGSARLGVYRASSTFGNALALGEYISIILPFVANFAVGPYRASTRIAAAITVPFMIYVVVLSGSRLGIVGSFLALALTLLAWAIERWRRDRASLMEPLIVLGYPAFLALAVASSFFVGRIRHVVWNGNGGASSTDARKLEFTMGLPKVLTHPQGYGIGQCAEVLGYAPSGILTIDSYILSLLLDVGPLGLFLFLGMILSGIAACVLMVIRLVSFHRDFEMAKPLAIALVNFLIIKSVFSEISNHPIIFMMLGMIATLAYRASRAADGRITASSGVAAVVRSPKTARFAGGAQA